MNAQELQQIRRFGPRQRHYEELVRDALSEPADPDVAPDLEHFRAGDIDRRTLARRVGVEVVGRVFGPLWDIHAVDAAVAAVLKEQAVTGGRSSVG